jgi:hypothetical protein
MPFSRICKIFCLFLAIQWTGVTLRADLMTPLTQSSCTTTADCPKDSWATCCSGKCMVVEGCCPGETPCGGSLCCSSDQRCVTGGGKCISKSACDSVEVMCQGTFSPIGKCCRKDLCSSSGQCCLEQVETICGEGCCARGYCTTTGQCCAEGKSCNNLCCPADKPFCDEGKCTAYCDKENPCPSLGVCTEATCCPEGSSSKLCGGRVVPLAPFV